MNRIARDLAMHTAQQVHETVSRSLHLVSPDKEGQLLICLHVAGMIHGKMAAIIAMSAGVDDISNETIWNFHAKALALCLAAVETKDDEGTIAALMQSLRQPPTKLPWWRRWL